MPLLGVPTHTRPMSVPATAASQSVVARSRPARHALLDELAEARLDHGRATLVQQVDLDRVGVDADHRVAVGGQAGGRDGADVAEPDRR